MSSPAKKFLRLFTDDSWHVFQKLPNDIAPATVGRCIAVGFVQTKKVNCRHNGTHESFQIALRITERGKEVLAD